MDKGTAILDSIVAIALFAVLFVGLFGLLQVGVKTVTVHKARAGALTLARSEIESIRSLDYSAVGVQGGNPSGNVVSSKTVVLNNITYTINVDITWHDDPGDGIGNADTNPNDYKAVRVQVSWSEHVGKTGSVVLSTFVSEFVKE